MSDAFFVDGVNLYGNTDKTVGPGLPLGYNGGVAFGADADTVLTTSSLRRQVVTPTANRNYTLPTGVLEKLGDTWTFLNLSTSFSVVLKASDASTITTVLPGMTVQIFAKQDNPTTNTHWVNIGGSPSVSQSRVGSYNGYGSTATFSRRFTTVFETTGTDITYADSATNGATWTLNVNGLYAISSVGTDATAGTYAITKNTTGAAAVGAEPATDILSAASAPTVGYNGGISWAGYLPAGTVLRHQTDGDATASTLARMTVSRIG